MLWQPNETITPMLGRVACQHFESNGEQAVDLFRREVRKQFRLGISNHWAIQFWDWVRDRSPDARVRQIAQRIGLSPGQISRGINEGELSLEMLIQILVRLAYPWRLLPPLPNCRDEVERLGYRAALGYVRWNLDGRPDDVVRRDRTRPSEEDVELLRAMDERTAWPIPRAKLWSAKEQQRFLGYVRTDATARLRRSVGCITVERLNTVQDAWSWEWQVVRTAVPLIRGGHDEHHP